MSRWSPRRRCCAGCAARRRADPTGLAALRLLWGGDEHCVCAPMQRLGASQSRMPRHMTTLTQAGLVTGRRDARWVRCRRAEPVPPAVTALVEAALVLPVPQPRPKGSQHDRRNPRHSPAGRSRPRRPPDRRRRGCAGALGAALKPVWPVRGLRDRPAAGGSGEPSRCRHRRLWHRRHPGRGDRRQGAACRRPAQAGRPRQMAGRLPNAGWSLPEAGRRDPPGGGVGRAAEPAQGSASGSAGVPAPPPILASRMVLPSSIAWSIAARTPTGSRRASAASSRS